MSTPILIDPVQKAREDDTRRLIAQEEADKKVDNLEADLAAQTSKLPDKFRGKTAEQIAEAYENLEQALGRKNNEVGQLRAMVDQLVPLEHAEKQNKVQAREPVKADDLFEDTAGTINRVVEENPVIQRTVQRAEELERSMQMNEFTTRHPTYSKDLANPEFISWIQKSPTRQHLAQAADQYNFAAAEELWALWGEYESIRGEATTRQKAEKQLEKDQQEAAGTLEGGTGNTTETKKTFSRSEIVDLKTRAMQGDRKAQVIVEDPVWQAEVRQAYFDKRVR